MTDYSFILTKAYPGKQWSMNGDDYKNIVWHDGQPISQKELDDAYIKYKADNDYIESRLKEYPNVFDQLDMLWHAIDKGLALKDSEFYSKIKIIKDKYPRPQVVNDGQ